jgi:hypothetical protein
MKMVSMDYKAKATQHAGGQSVSDEQSGSVIHPHVHEEPCRRW